MKEQAVYAIEAMQEEYRNLWTITYDEDASLTDKINGYISCSVQCSELLDDVEVFGVADAFVRAYARLARRIEMSRNETRKAMYEELLGRIIAIEKDKTMTEFQQQALALLGKIETSHNITERYAYEEAFEQLLNEVHGGFTLQEIYTLLKATLETGYDSPDFYACVNGFLSVIEKVTRHRNGEVSRKLDPKAEWDWFTNYVKKQVRHYIFSYQCAGTERNQTQYKAYRECALWLLSFL